METEKTGITGIHGYFPFRIKGVLFAKDGHGRVYEYCLIEVYLDPGPEGPNRQKDGAQGAPPVVRTSAVG